MPSSFHPASRMQTDKNRLIELDAVARYPIPSDR